MESCDLWKQENKNYVLEPFEQLNEELQGQGTFIESFFVPFELTENWYGIFKILFSVDNWLKYDIDVINEKLRQSE